MLDPAAPAAPDGKWPGKLLPHAPPDIRPPWWTPPRVLCAPRPPAAPPPAPLVLDPPKYLLILFPCVGLAGLADRLREKDEDEDKEEEEEEEDPRGKPPGIIMLGRSCGGASGGQGSCVTGSTSPSAILRASSGSISGPR